MPAFNDGWLGVPARPGKPRQNGLTHVMDKGLKVEEGSHDELIAREGAYFRLYQAQQRQAEANRDLLPEE